LPGSYDPWTILGSFLIACFAGFAAFESIDHTQFSDKPRRWAALGGCALGLGIWSVHFVGMIAWQPDYSLYYSVDRTLLSVLIAVTASIFAMLRVVRNQLSGKSSSGVLEAVLVGCGICAMHYIGMSALKFDKGVMWHPGWVFVSLVIAIAASWAAMYLLELSRTDVASLSRRLLASIAIALAICGMHYAGMKAFMPNAGSICIHQPFSCSGALLARVGVGNALLFTIVLLLASYREKNIWIEMVGDSHLQTLETARRLGNMSVIEKIAASVAKEINNPLEAAMNHLELIDVSEIGSSGRIHRTAAQHELRRIADIATHTSKFFLLGEGPTPASIPELFESVVALFQSPLRTADIDVKASCPQNLPTVLCYEGEIRQVIATLVSNAIDAMPEGGTIRLGVRPENDGLMVTVTDTGINIPAELRDKVLRPFFTTKGLRDRGLSLSIISETIRRNGGTSTFASPAPGFDVGTEFRFFLPFDCRMS
jgi:NO-binding membrane sensor protein with MHYT domain/nitrogen-specific signal transduction histidine kinase